MTTRWCCVVLLVCACTRPAGIGGEPAKQGVRTEARKRPETRPDAVAPPVMPAPLAGGEDWLVWSRVVDRWTTRWVQVAGDRAQPVAEVDALVVGDGPRVWVVERSDVVADTKGCHCMDPRVDETKCPPNGKIGIFGLRARELTGATVIDVLEASSDLEVGDDIWYMIAIVGGSQGKLYLSRSTSGDFCGYKGLYEASFEAFDLATGRAIDEPLGGWWKGLPEPLRTGAAESMRAELVACGDEATVQEIRDRSMRLDHVVVQLVRGRPTIHWRFTADATYACSADYQVAGDATSGLIPEAAPLGLAGPLPPGVEQALADVRLADAVGFSKLALPDGVRAVTIAKFEAIPGGSWPLGDATESDLTVPSEAQARIDEGLRRTREERFPEAIAAYDAAVAADPSLARAYFGRGYARLVANDLKKARDDLEEALRRDSRPQFQAAVLFHLGQVAEKLGNRKAARMAYERSLALREARPVQRALAALAATRR